MKRLISAAAFLLCLSAVSFGQSRGLEMIVKAGIAPSFTYYDTQVNATFQAGYRLNKYIAFSGGTGLALNISDKSYSVLKDGKVASYTASPVSIPVFVNFKANFTKSRVSPFFTIDLGDKICCSKYPDLGGLYTLPALGLDIKLGSSMEKAISIQFGAYLQQNRGGVMKTSKEAANFCNGDFRIGFRF